MMNITISVIIPVHNVERFIVQCSNSILAQYRSYLEIILIDDGSTDDSDKICCEFASQDNRIIVIQTPPSGVSFARTIGLHVATGDLVMFVDSDDWLDLDTVKQCVSEFEKNPNLDCLLFTYAKEYEGNTYPKHTFESDLRIDNKKDFQSIIYRRLFGLTNEELDHPERLEYMTTCWGKVYRREKIQNCRFVDNEQIGSCEDGLFNMDALLNCQSAVYLDKPFYHYRYTTGSLTLKYRPRLSNQWHRLFALMQQRLDNNGLSADFREALNNRLALSVLGIGMNEMDNSDGSFFQFAGYMKQYISSSDYRAAIKTMKLQKLPLPWKVLMLCCKCRFGFGTALILKAIRMIKNRL